MQRRMWQRGPDGEIIRARAEPQDDRSASAGQPPSDEGETPETVAAAPRRASLGLALRLGVRDSYDYLGTFLVLSFLWMMLSGFAVATGQALGNVLFGGLTPALGTLLSILTGLAALVLLVAPLTAGIFRYARNAAAREEPELYDLAWGFRCALGESLGLGAIQAFGVVLLAGNCYFYVSQGHPVVVVIGAVFGYVLAFWLAACMYQWPLLVEQRLRPIVAVKKSALLVLDNFPFTAVLALILAILSGVLWLTVIGAALLWAGVMAMLLTQATRELLRKYGLLGPDPTLDPIAGETHDLDR